MMFSLRTDSEWDLESLNSTHVCVEDLQRKCDAMARSIAGMRRLLRRPATDLLQRWARGCLSRHRLVRHAAAIRIQSRARVCLSVKRPKHKRLRSDDLRCALQDLTLGLNHPKS